MSMMKTSDSYPREHKDRNKMVIVKASDPQSVSTFDEINLYLKGREKFREWKSLIEKNKAPYVYVEEIKTLQKITGTLPSEYDLVNVRYSWVDPKKNIYFYTSMYTTFSSSYRDQFCRSIILLNLRVLIDFMHTWKKRFKELFFKFRFCVSNGFF